jgi:hypothetical protein
MAVTLTHGYGIASAILKPLPAVVIFFLFIFKFGRHILYREEKYIYLFSLAILFYFVFQIVGDVFLGIFHLKALGNGEISMNALSSFINKKDSNGDVQNSMTESMRPSSIESKKNDENSPISASELYEQNLMYLYISIIFYICSVFTLIVSFGFKGVMKNFYYGIEKKINTDKYIKNTDSVFPSSSIDSELSPYSEKNHISNRMLVNSKISDEAIDSMDLETNNKKLLKEMNDDGPEKLEGTEDLSSLLWREILKANGKMDSVRTVVHTQFDLLCSTLGNFQWYFPILLFSVCIYILFILADISDNAMVLLIFLCMPQTFFMWKSISDVYNPSIRVSFERMDLDQLRVFGALKKKVYGLKNSKESNSSKNMMLNLSSTTGSVSSPFQSYYVLLCQYFRVFATMLTFAFYVILFLNEFFTELDSTLYRTLVPLTHYLGLAFLYLSFNEYLQNQNLLETKYKIKKAQA